MQIMRKKKKLHKNNEINSPLNKSWKYVALYENRGQGTYYKYNKNVHSWHKNTLKKNLSPA